MSEHCFDRLAAPRTRRDVLGTALAGVALTLPFARSARAWGAARPARSTGCPVGKTNDPNACQKGCYYMSHTTYDNAARACGRFSNSIFYGGLASMLVGVLNPVYFAVNTGTAVLSESACRNRAILEQKARAFDCLQPGCPGFDPCGPDGPCESCVAAKGLCCPDSRVIYGYSCCTICCSPKGDGCRSGSTECGKNP